MVRYFRVAGHIKVIAKSPAELLLTLVSPTKTGGLMAIAILEIFALLSFLILPLTVTSKEKRIKNKHRDKTIISDNYVVNRYGEIEELLNKEGKKEDYYHL
jgi:hypothetical protein